MSYLNKFQHVFRLIVLVFYKSFFDLKKASSYACIWTNFTNPFLLLFQLPTIRHVRVVVKASGGISSENIGND